MNCLVCIFCFSIFCQYILKLISKSVIAESKGKSTSSCTKECQICLHIKLYHFAFLPASLRASTTVYITKLLYCCQSEWWKLVLQYNFNLSFSFRRKYEPLYAQLESICISVFYPFSIIDLSQISCFMTSSMNFLKHCLLS